MEQTVVKKEPEELVDISEGDISMNYDNQEIPSTSGITIKQEIKEELDNDEVLLDKGYIISLPQRYLNIPAHNFGSKINNSEENDNSVDEDESRDLSCNIKEEGMDIDFAKGDKISLHNKEKDEDEAMFETKIKVEHHGVQYDESGTNQEVANKELVEETGKEIGKNPESEFEDTFDSIYQCKNCSNQFFNKEFLESHEEKCLKPRAKNKLFKCSMCSKSYQTKSSLLEHRKYVHKKDQQEQFKCEKCGYQTLKKSHFKIHLKIHDKNNQLKCNFCDYTAAKLYTLNAHLLSKHNNENNIKITSKIHSCSNCSYLTVKKSTYDIHVKACNKKTHDKMSAKLYFK
ncbi:unnamed protein product [Brassicogethes aeneus]|uniref:C2H2-type domain-containing protein n=1 Tax=Brassicogethes aeneus TaxID=1431903 RepID=A0A9P0FCL5_BRAAE|nr:unnamed protein product [Brassicogethes aeneus]